MALDDAAGFAAAQHAQPLTVGDAGLVGVPQEWRTVGHLYRGIEAGLAWLCDRYGEDGVFIGPARAQAVTDIFEWPELIAVTDLGSAGRAIETIVEQGKGARGDWIRSHFGTFVGVLEDLLALQVADPGFDPARPVEPAFVRLPPDVESGTLIEDPTTAQVADLANGVYEVVLQVLSRYYIHHGETAAEYDTLARTAKHLMNWVMRELGPVLTTLPVGPSHPAARPVPPSTSPAPPRPVPPSTSPAPPSSCCRTRTRPGRSSRNGSTRWSRPAPPSAARRASARSPHSPASCARCARTSRRTAPTQPDSTVAATG